MLGMVGWQNAHRAKKQQNVGENLVIGDDELELVYLKTNIESVKHKLENQHRNHSTIKLLKERREEDQFLPLFTIKNITIWCQQLMST